MSLIKKSGTKTSGDGAFVDWWLIATGDREEVMEFVRTFVPEPFTGGPGQEFLRTPTIRRRKGKSLILQRGGLDI